MKYPLILFFVLLGAGLGCNLSTVPPTPISPPSPTPGSILVPADQSQEFPSANDDSAGFTGVNSPCPSTPIDWIQYTIEAGDSLSLLAEQTGSTVDQLVTANCLDNPDDILVDSVIYLPRQPTIVSD